MSTGLDNGRFLICGSVEKHKSPQANLSRGHFHFWRVSTSGAGGEESPRVMSSSFTGCLSSLMNLLKEYRFMCVLCFPIVKATHLPPLSIHSFPGGRFARCLLLSRTRLIDQRPLTWQPVRWGWPPLCLWAGRRNGPNSLSHPWKWKVIFDTIWSNPLPWRHDKAPRPRSGEKT